MRGLYVVQCTCVMGSARHTTVASHPPADPRLPACVWLYTLPGGCYNAKNRLFQRVDGAKYGVGR